MLTNIIKNKKLWIWGMEDTQEELAGGETGCNAIIIFKDLNFKLFLIVWIFL